MCVCVCVCGCAKATWPYYASQILPRMMNSVYLDLGKIYNITMKMLNQMWQVDVCCQVRCCSICYSHFTAVGIQWWSINSQKERDPKAMEEAFTTPPVAVGIAASGDLFFFSQSQRHDILKIIFCIRCAHSITYRRHTNQLQVIPRPREFYNNRGQSYRIVFPFCFLSIAIKRGT